MSLNPVSPPDHLCFDDEPIESILYDSPADRATSANVDDEIEQLLEEINQCAYSGNQVRTFALMAWLLRSDLPVSETACRMVTHAFKQVVSNYPKPVVSNVVIEYRFLLDKIINLTTRFEANDILATARTISYRLCEGLGEFGKARTLISTMLDRIDQGNSRKLAQLTNDYGYEFLLECNYLEAQPYFIESLVLFENLNSKTQIANAQANLLTCQFALAPFRDWEALLPTLRETHRVLLAVNDWRIRKTMRLFAARAEAQGRYSVAIAWARRATDASYNLETQLHRDDETYLDSLRGKRLQGKLFDHPDNTRHTGGNPEDQT